MVCGLLQVVLLGAGMDTRAWRLELPPGVAWFEVDTADVLGAKRAIMTRAGAQWPERAALVDGEGGRRVAQRRAQFEGEGDATGARRREARCGRHGAVMATGSTAA